MTTRIQLKDRHIEDALVFLKLLFNSCEVVGDINEYGQKVFQRIEEFEARVACGERLLNPNECNQTVKLINRGYISVDKEEWERAVTKVRQVRTRRNEKNKDFDERSSRIEVKNDVKTRLKEIKNFQQYDSYNLVVLMLLDFYESSSPSEEFKKNRRGKGEPSDLSLEKTLQKLSPPFNFNEHAVDHGEDSITDDCDLDLDARTESYEEMQEKQRALEEQDFSDDGSDSYEW